MPAITESSVLASSSPYLNHAGLREWFGAELLRKNGPDRRPISDNTALNRALGELRDNDAVDAMFERDRQTSPALDAWMREKFYSTFTAEDLARLAPDSVGGIYYERIRAGIELDIGFSLSSRNWYEYAIVRYSRNHDFEHILTGGPFTFPGEYVPIYAMITNTHNYLSPDLAAFIGLRSALGSQRFLSRAVLHYPRSVPAFLDCIAQGIAVGLASDPIRLIRIEDVLALPPAAARAQLGVREAVDLETEPWASHWLDPSDEAAVEADKSLPYIKRGLRAVPTTSSVLASSSKYLNEPALRDWTATAMLRRCGADYPDAVEYARLQAILGGLRDAAAFDARAQAARRSDPTLDRLLGETPRGHAWDALDARVAEVEAALAPALGGTGAALDAIMPGWAMVANLFQHLDPELAGELCVARVLGLQRFIVRAQLHYPRSWIPMARAIRQGILIGKASPPLYGNPVDALRGLAPAETRRRLGIEAWAAVDMRAASAAYGEDPALQAAE